jgi:hypothetical protein
MCFEWARSGEDMWVEIKWGLKMDGVGIEVGQIIKRVNNSNTTHAATHCQQVTQKVAKKEHLTKKVQ